MMFVSVCLLQPVVCGSFLPQGLIPRPKSWESCHPSNELQQKAKVGHSLGLLTLPTDALSAASFEIDGTLANEKGRVGKPFFSSSKEAILSIVQLILGVVSWILGRKVPVPSGVVPVILNIFATICSVASSVILYINLRGSAGQKTK